MSDVLTEAPQVVTPAEEIVSKAITDPKTTPMTDKFSIQELQSANYITTPIDTPLLNLLLKKGSVRSGNYLFEWTESVLSSDFTSAIYDGYTTTGISQANGASTRKGNYLSAVGQIAVVSGMTKELDTIEGNPMRLEVQQKYLHLMRCMEYLLWKGNHTTSNLQTNGVEVLVTTAVDNTSGVLKQNSLDSAIVQAVDAGIMPTHIFCSPNDAQVIAGFAKNRIFYTNTVDAGNGIGKQALMYVSPFGLTLEVTPVRDVYKTTATIYVLDMTLVTLRHAGASVVQSQQLSAGMLDGEAVLFKSYLGLELKNADAHRVITNVAQVLA